MDLVLLPSTEPDDETYGFAPDRIETFPEVSVHQIRFPRLVWYNEAIREDTVAQIRNLGVSSIVLAGFSKSGLGVWNVAQMIPDLISGMILFDDPMMLLEPPMPLPNPYYEDAEAWLVDLPTRTVKKFEAIMPKTSRLVLISGESFHEEMDRFAEVPRESKRRPMIGRVISASSPAGEQTKASNRAETVVGHCAEVVDARFRHRSVLRRMSRMN